MKFNPADPENEHFACAIGITEERADEMKNRFAEWAKDYSPTRVQPDGTIYSRFSVIDLLVGFLEPADENNIKEIVYCAFQAGANAQSKREEAARGEAPSGLEAAMEAIAKAVKGGHIQLGGIKITGRDSDLKKKKIEPEDDGIQDF